MYSQAGSGLANKDGVPILDIGQLVAFISAALFSLGPKMTRFRVRCLRNSGCVPEWSTGLQLQERRTGVGTDAPRWSI